jgi:hypothetical protein
VHHETQQLGHFSLKRVGLPDSCAVVHTASSLLSITTVVRSPTQRKQLLVVHQGLNVRRYFGAIGLKSVVATAGTKP